MPNAMDGVQRAIERLRVSEKHRSLTVRRFNRRAVGLTRRIVDLLVPVPTRRPKGHVAAVPRHLVSRRDLARAQALQTAAADHGAPGALATGAHAQSRHPARGAAAILRAIAGLQPRFRSTNRLRLQRRLIRVRLGGERALPMGIALAVIVAGAVSLGQGVVRPVGAATPAEQPVRLAIGGQGARVDYGAEYDTTAAADLGPYVDDGTFYKPVAVDTTVESGSDLLRHYTVKAGDTLTGIASKFDVSMMTLWWANHLTSKDSLHQGQVLVIPPVNGLVVTVAEGDTLDAIAAKYDVDADAIVQLNNLSDPTLVVGQVLILPGAKGAPIPTAKPAPRTTTSSSGSTTTRTYSTSGSWAWPVPGGYISQYFHYGHYGVDIAAPYGSRIIAARGGTVVYASWNSDGCGYEVTIYIGSNLYIQNCHMSSIGVHVGQSVYKGQYIGRVGSSGWASGPHDHFAVSVGRPFTSGAYFVNPLRYY